MYYMKLNRNNRRILPMFLAALILFMSFDFSVSAETTKTITSFAALRPTSYNSQT